MLTYYAIKSTGTIVYKESDLRSIKPYSGKTHCERNTKSSVVPAPIPLGREVTITDFLFSKHGEIFATTISPSANE